MSALLRVPAERAVSRPPAVVRLPGGVMPTGGAHVISALLRVPAERAVSRPPAVVRLPGGVMPTGGAGVMSARLRVPAERARPSAVAPPSSVMATPMTARTRCVRPPEPALTRRGSPGPAAATPLPLNPHCTTPVPSPAHPTPRAIRVRRSPR